MTQLTPFFPKDDVLLSLTNQNILDKITNILEMFWLPPHEMDLKIKETILPLEQHSDLRIVVSGETKNISLYIISLTAVLVVMPFSSIDSNVLLQEVYGEFALPQGHHWYIFPSDEVLLQRLTLPRVLLVNPCVLENFPIPRLCLSIGLVGSYLRKFQKADVRIIDMQVGSTIEDIVREARTLQPDLFGMSISYGQKHLALSILKEIYKAKDERAINPLIVLGNIISASFPKEFLTIYPDSIVVCGEGEVTIIELMEYISGERKLADVSGIAYTDGSGKIQRTLNKSVPMENIPLPSLDTINDIARCRGAVTLELSRGCQWNVCTFCPREHKSSHWKTFTTPQILEQFRSLSVVCDKFGIKRHIFLADEEFLGGINDGKETTRMADVARSLIKDKFSMSFDAAARVDQVYEPQMNREWHIKRMEMWHLTRKAGLDRLFMGIESGSEAQLKRYGKGIKPEHSVYAIRILSALGIPLRFGFVTFDQLMVGLKDLKENIAFLERTDAFMNEINVEDYGYEKLFDLLIHDQEFIAAHSANKPIHSGVSYMLASMEVLLNSRYKIMLDNAEKRYGKRLILDKDFPDTNMGRYKVDFLDDLIGDISKSSQKWIDRHFGLSYAIKSLYKVAPKKEKEYLSNWMILYRRISFILVKALIYIFDEHEIEKRAEALADLALLLQDDYLVRQIEKLYEATREKRYSSRMQIIEDCMDLFDGLVEQANQQIERLMKSGLITDTADSQIMGVMHRWKENKGVWMLINDPSKVAV